MEPKSIKIFPLDTLFKTYPFPFKSPSSTNNKFSKVSLNDHRIGWEYRYILSTLSIFGSSPITYNSETERYVCKLSCRTFFVFLSSLLSIAIWTEYWINIVYNITFVSESFESGFGPSAELLIQSAHPNNKLLGTFIYKSIKIVIIFFPMSQLADMLFNWTQSKLYVQFLNNWITQFEPRLSTIFIQEFNERKKFFQRIKLSNFIAVSSSIFSGLVGAVTAMNEKPSSTDKLLALNIALRLGFLDMVDEIKTLFMYRDVAEGLRQIHRRLDERIRLDVTVSEDNVRGWRDIIEVVRGQCELLEECQKPSQLYFIIRCVVTSTLITFISLNLPLSDPSWRRFAFSWIIFAVVQAARILLKAWMAENITTQESKIAKILSRINTSHCDVKTFMQIKFLQDLIIQTPSVVSLGKYVELNKKLLLKIFSQVVTYLIVLMQFSQRND